MTSPPTAPTAAKLPRWGLVLAAAVLAAGSWWQSGLPDPAPVDAPYPPVEKSAAPSTPETESAAINAPRQAVQPATSRASQSKGDPARQPEFQTIVRNVTVKDLNGRVAFHGDVDLQPTLDRIARGEKFPHRNDGGTFRNLERRLPSQSNGYYKEYVHPTPGIDGPGPQRIILGRDGDAHYTHDHYLTFKRIR